MKKPQEPSARRSRDRRPTCIDIFAGAGGLSEGFRQAGFRIAAAMDRSAAAARTFQQNFPEAGFCTAPASELSGDQLLAAAGIAPGALDCLIGGPPCQAFSFINHKRDQHAAQSEELSDYLRIVQTIRPKCVIIENVPGMLEVLDDRMRGAIYRELATLGYQCQARTLHSEEYGVPQRQRRVFFIASRIGDVAELFPAPGFRPNTGQVQRRGRIARTEGVQAGPSLPATPDVWSAIGDLPWLANGGQDGDRPYPEPPRNRYQIRMRRGSNRICNHVTRRLGEVLLERIEHIPPGGNWRDIPFNLLPGGMQKARPQDHTKRYGRLTKDGLASTILTECDPHSGCFLHPEANRTLSVREAARLQSFPDRFRFAGRLKEQFRLVGNAVPPMLSAAIGERIVRAIEQARW